MLIRIIARTVAATFIDNEFNIFIENEHEKVHSEVVELSQKTRTLENSCEFVRFWLVRVRKKFEVTYFCPDWL